jgi:hypothetical protein
VRNTSISSTPAVMLSNRKTDLVSSTGPRWLLPALTSLIVGGFLLKWSWGKWLHPVVDFGRELYVPWQMLEGKALYRDLSYFNGPLSPFVNAVGFSLVGVGLQTLVWMNILVLVAVTALLVVLIARFSDIATAVIGSAVFLICFALADPTGSGTYNFIAPYSHEITHGFLLALVALALLFQHIRRPTRWSIIGIGLATGLVFLTKIELFVAIAPLVVLGLWLSGRQQQLSPGTRVRRIALMIAAMALPSLVAFLLLLPSSSASSAIRGVLGSWRYAFSSKLQGLDFYRGGMGLLDPLDSLVQILVWLLAYLLIFVPAFWFARRSTSEGRSRSWLPAVSGLVTVVLTILILSRLSVLDVTRPLPVFLGVLAIALVRQHFAGKPVDGPSSRQTMLPLLATLFSFGMLLKILFRVRLSHYGFVLAAPATMILIILLLHVIPRWIDRRGGHGNTFRAAGVGFFLVVATFHLSLTARNYAAKNQPVGSGGDSFLADASGEVVSETLSRLEKLLLPGETMAVLPEGVMLNYLLRRESPTPYFNFMPPELVMFGEDAIVESFDARPPDWIVMTGRGATEYGYDYLGRGYGERLANWVQDNYLRVELVGVEGPADPTFMSWTMILRLTDSSKRSP